MATSQRTNIDTLIVGELQSLVCLPDIEIAFSLFRIRSISVVSSQHVRHCTVVTSVKTTAEPQNNVVSCTTFNLSFSEITGQCSVQKSLLNSGAWSRVKAQNQHLSK